MSADLDARFTAAAESVKTFKASKPVPNESKLVVYGLYKQATAGDVATARPGGFLNFEANAKWDAYHAVKGMPPAEAKEKYIAEVQRQQREYA